METGGAFSDGKRESGFQSGLEQPDHQRGDERGAAQALLSYDWPGNVRQLQNCIESAVILCGQEEIDSTMLSLGPARAGWEPPAAGQRSYGTLREETARFEHQVLRAVLEQCGGSREEAAKHLGISQRTFYRKWEGD